MRRAPGRLRSTRGAPAAVTRESGRFGDRRRRRNLGGGGTCGGAKLAWRRSRAGRRVRAWRSWRRQWRGMGKAQGCGQFKGGPRASWGSVPWRRGAILGEKGGVRCAAGEMDLAGGATASAAAGACGCCGVRRRQVGPGRGEGEGDALGRAGWRGLRALVRGRPGSGLNGGGRARAWAALAAELGRSGTRARLR